MAAGHPSPGTILIGSESPAEDSRSTPFVVGVAGHRDLSAEGLARIGTAARDFLLQLRAHLPDTELRVMSGLAAGSDLLVAQVALDLEIAVDAVLPMPLQQYAEDFDAQSLPTLEALIRHPKVRATELPSPARAHGFADGDGLTERDARYFNLAQRLLRTCNLLIAVWDGKSPPLPGGTSDTVLRFLEIHADRGAQHEGWLFTDAPAEEDAPLRLVFWIPAARIGSEPAGDLGPPCFLSGLGENVLQRWRSMPSQLREQLGQLNTYNREYQSLLHSGQWSAPDSLMNTLSPSVEVPEQIRPTLRRIDAQYGKADGLAMYFQRRSDRLFTFFSVTAFVMGCAYLAYEKFVEVRALLMVYLVVLLLSFGLYYTLHGRRWFAKHLMCRALAETLRAKFYLCLGGAEHLVDAEEVVSLSGIDRFHGFGWIVHVLTSFETPALQGADQVAPGGSSAAVEMGWIESQRQYFVSKVALLERSSRRTARLQRALFVVILLVVLSLILLGESAHRIQVVGVPLKNVLTFAMGLLAVVLGVWELHQSKMATRELLWQYRNQLNHFSRARTQLAQTTTESRRRQILAALGKDSLMESYLWTIHRYHREHEPPGRG